MADVSDKKGQY